MLRIYGSIFFQKNRELSELKGVYCNDVFRSANVGPGDRINLGSKIKWLASRHRPTQGVVLHTGEGIMTSPLPYFRVSLFHVFSAYSCGGEKFLIK